MPIHIGPKPTRVRLGKVGGGTLSVNVEGTPLEGPVRKYKGLKAVGGGVLAIVIGIVIAVMTFPNLVPLAFGALLVLIGIVAILWGLKNFFA